MNGLLSLPRPGDVVGSRVRVKGTIEVGDPNQRMWIVHRRVEGGAYWPKEPEVVCGPDGTFDIVTHEAGAPGQIVVSLVAATNETSTAFENWFAVGHKSGEYPGIPPNAYELLELASVHVVYSQQQPLRLFISYAHEDEKYRQALGEHLVVLRRQRIVETWHDRMISAGTDFSREIDAQLRAADVILLLVSASFLASDYCYEKEMELALERHSRGEARVMPIIIRACDWEAAPFGHLLAVCRRRGDIANS